MELIQEIKQSGAAMLALIDNLRTQEAKALAAGFRALIENKGYKRFIFTGMGSSHCAAFPACHYLHSKGIDARAIESGELLLYGLPTDALIIAISQSGHSEEVIALLDALESETVVTVTNYPGNSMYAPGRLTFPICAGTETKSSSKSYTNTLGILMYMAYLISGEDTDGLLETLGLYAKDIDSTIENVLLELDNVCAFMGDTSYLPVTAGGVSYATACQAEILIMEISRICSARFTCGQFMHGTVELLSSDFRGVVLDFQEKSREGVDNCIRETAQTGGKLWLITNRDKSFGPNVHVTYLPLVSISRMPLLSPIIEIEPIILYTEYIAGKKGLRPGVLRTVQK